jgi:hypothetical protein
MITTREMITPELIKITNVMESPSGTAHDARGGIRISV